MRPLFRVSFISAAVPIALAFAIAAETPAAAPAHARAPSLAPRVELQPPIVRLRQRPTIVVSGMHIGSLEARLAGATDRNGNPLPWHSVRLVAGTWRGTLPAPAWRGIYRVVLRERRGAMPLETERLFLRVLALGSLARPSFDDPADVARWWVKTVPHATLVALKPWPRPGFDQRDVRLHRLFVVAYSPPGHPQVRDRLGMFVTAFRDGYDARWRLLEATVLP